MRMMCKNLYTKEVTDILYFHLYHVCQITLQALHFKFNPININLNHLNYKHNLRKILLRSLFFLNLNL